MDSVMATNDDASECKRSAVDLGYWSDIYISCFARKSRRRPPEINLGYYARVRAVERLIGNFISRLPRPESVQILSLGAGFDTLYWRLRRDRLECAAFVEVDLAPVVARKLRAIRQHTTLTAAFNRECEVIIQNGCLHAGEYHLISGDISRPSQVLPSIISQCNLSATAPTVVLSECVLVYVPVNSGNELLKQLADFFNSAIYINYEMVLLSDRFGEVLMENLRARGCDLAGASACMTPQTQVDRFLSCGWNGARVWTMNQVLQDLPQQDVQRVRRLELMEDVSVLQQLLEHYGVCLAWKERHTEQSLPSSTCPASTRDNTSSLDLHSVNFG